MTDDPTFEAELESLRARYIAGLADRIAALTAAFESGDRAEVTRLAHKLVGAAMYGFDDLSHAAKQLELASARGLPLEALLEETRRQAERLRAD